MAIINKKLFKWRLYRNPDNKNKIKKIIRWEKKV